MQEKSNVNPDLLARKTMGVCHSTRLLLTHLLKITVTAGVESHANKQYIIFYMFYNRYYHMSRKQIGINKYHFKNTIVLFFPNISNSSLILSCKIGLSTIISFLNILAEVRAEMPHLIYNIVQRQHKTSWSIWQDKTVLMRMLNATVQQRYNQTKLELPESLTDRIKFPESNNPSELSSNCFLLYGE